MENNSSDIFGISIAPRRKINDDRGSIFHMLKRTDPEFREFGEIYFSKVFPGVVKGWHRHKKMWLNYFVVVGSIRLVLHDDREDSPTRGRTQEVFLDENDSKIVVIPPLVWNGFKGLGANFSLLANCATLPEDPQEIQRRPYDDPYFHYDWRQRNG